MDYLQVEGKSDLVRDVKSGAIINRNRSAYELAKRRAGELCNGSYDILEQDLEKSSFYKKPSVKLIIQCK